MSLDKALGYFTGREFHDGLFSSPQQNAQESAAGVASVDNAEIAQEEGYVDKSEGQLRNAIAGLGPNPYFAAPKPPAAVNPANTSNFFSAAPQSAGTAAPAARGTAPSNLFAPPPPRQAQPVMRAPAAATP